MAKPRRASMENNRKMTDFFNFRPPPSSAPLVSNSARQRSGKQPPESRKSTLSLTQPASQLQTKSSARLVSSQPRTMKKENAPPFPRMQPTLDREVTYISSSSDAPTRISISSTSVQSIDSSVVEVVPPLKQDRRRLQTIDIASSPAKSQRTRSPRVQSPKQQGARNNIANGISRMRNHAAKKRKKPDGVQSDDGDVIDLESMEEVIYVTSKPTKPSFLAPQPSMRSRSSPARKRTCLNVDQPPDTSSDVVEVIPSSQSDEKEMTLPKKTGKNLREVTESVREWQLSSSQPDVPPDSSDAFELDARYDDFGMDVDFDYPPVSTVAREGSKTPVSNARISKASTASTPRKESRSQTLGKSPSPRKSSSSVPGSAQIPSGSKSPSPMLVSSASSSTKVDMPVYALSPKKTMTPRSSPYRKSIASDSHSQRSPYRVASNAQADMDMDVRLLNENKKTNTVVERIKAEARAKAMAIPDEDSMVLGSLDDSDSDDLGSPTNLMQFAKDRKAVQPTKTSASRTTDTDELDERGESPLTDVDELDHELRRRRNTRRQPRRSPSPPLSTTSTRTRKAPNMRPTTITNVTHLPRKRTANPFSKLLKEKARHDRFADLRKNLDLDLDLDLDATLPGAADDRSMVWSPSKPGSQLTRQPSDEGDLEKVVGEVGRRKLFGEEDENVLGRILESDRRDKGKGQAMSTELGVPLWESFSEEAMEMDTVLLDLPRLEALNDVQSLALLKEFLDAKDVDGAVALLQSGMFIIKDAAFSEWLLEVAVCSRGTLASAAYTALGHVYEVQPRMNQRFVVSISPVLKALSRFGARQDILESLQLEASACEPLPFDITCSEAPWRLSESIRSFASKGFLDRADVPSYFAVFLAIGMDPKSGSNLKMSIKRTLNTLIGTYCGEFTDERGEVERDICSRVLGLTPDLSPANKAYLLSFVDGDNLVARRIAQWIAFAMLTGDYGSRMAKEFVAGPPLLSDIIALLNPRLDSELRSDLFNVSRNSGQFDSFDYAGLAHHIEVLGRVLMNIPQYVLIEKRERMRNNEAPSKGNNEPSKLQIIKDLLDRLGNNIADTRAAHLDRSQAKAVILQLAMRIHYQRSAGSVTERSRIENFFKRKAGRV